MIYTHVHTHTHTHIHTNLQFLNAAKMKQNLHIHVAGTHIQHTTHTHILTIYTGWRSVIGCLKSQVIFRKRAL